MKIGFIGCGNMGEAILAGIHRQYACYACEPRPERQAALKKQYKVVFGMAADVVKMSDVIILAVKPQDLPELLAEMSRLPLGNKLVVSIAAGVTTASIGKKLGSAVRVIRVMPNLPAMAAAGMSGLCRGKRATEKDAVLVKGFFDLVGQVLVVPERAMDAVTAVSGSGPAYVFLFVECMITAARKLGFTQKDARLLVYQTLAGSAKMLAQSEELPGVLRKKVTSKGGTTAAAIDVFQGKDIQSVFTEALTAACARAKELSR